jgi:hypothetical protein
MYFLTDFQNGGRNVLRNSSNSSSRMIHATKLKKPGNGSIDFFEGLNETKQESVHQKSIKHKQESLHAVGKQNVSSVYRNGQNSLKRHNFTPCHLSTWIKLESQLLLRHVSS